MDHSQNQSSSLGCEIMNIRAKNINLKSKGQLFIRNYISAGNNTRIRLNSKEISANSELVWNELTLLDCSGTQASMDKLIKGTVVFELRWRKNSSSIFRHGSQLLGRAEIPWKSVFEAPDMELEKWVVMTSKRHAYDEDVKPSMVQISMKLRAPTVTETTKQRSRSKVVKWNECGCGDSICKSCLDYDLFALDAILEGF